jgi:hypothetical protein
VDIDLIALFLHVTGAAVLVGALLLEVSAGVQLRTAEDVRAVRTCIRFSRTATPLGGAAWLVLLATGGHLAGANFSFAEGWITVSAVALVLAAAAGPLVHGRRLKIIGAAATGDGPIPADLRARILDPVLWASVHGLVGVAIGFIYAMTNKTGFVGTSVALLLPGSIGAAVGVALAKRDATSRSPVERAPNA